MKTYIAVTLLLLGASFADAATGAPWGRERWSYA
jgi:hypothetical protein